MRVVAVWRVGDLLWSGWAWIGLVVLLFAVGACADDQDTTVSRDPSGCRWGPSSLGGQLDWFVHAAGAGKAVVISESDDVLFDVVTDCAIPGPAPSSSGQTIQVGGYS
ncbi:MAG: hypothetical protein GY788_08800, partial [bacterium]|nr:hypothetical protein [bacterium]